MKQYHYIVAFLFVASFWCFAQEPAVGWTKEIAKDSLPAKSGDQSGIRSHSICETSNHGFAMTGHCCCSHCNGDLYIVRTDSAGNILWTQRYDDRARDEVGNCIQETSDRGFIIAGVSENPASNRADGYVIKTDSLGVLIWETIAGDTSYGRLEVLYAVQETFDHGFIAAGYASSNGNSDAYLVKLDANGNILWSKTVGGQRNDWVRWVEQTTDSGFIFCGATYSFGAGGSDAYVVRTNAAGDTQWTRTFGGSEVNDGAYCIRQTTGNGFIMTGQTNDYTDIYLVRLDVQGDLVWEKAVGSDTTSECGRTIRQTPDNGFLIGGHTGVDTANSFFVRTDVSGNVLWTKTLDPGGTAHCSYIHSLQLTLGGGVIAAGWSGYGDTQADHRIYLIKLLGL